MGLAPSLLVLYAVKKAPKQWRVVKVLSKVSNLKTVPFPLVPPPSATPYSTVPDITKLP